MAAATSAIDPSEAAAKDPRVLALDKKVDALAARSSQVTIKTAEQYAEAGKFLTEVKAAQKEHDELRFSLTRPLDQLKQRIMDLFRPKSEKLAGAERAIKAAMRLHSDEQERLRREEQRRADEEARRQQERLNERAARAQASGKVEKAEQLQQQASTVVAPVIQRAPPKVAGISETVVWQFEVTNEALVPREYLSVDLPKIRKVVQALTGQASIAGVRIWPEKQIRWGSAS
ncbi:MAG: hypothetical protein ACRD3Q_20440 [Terriglobales bacterium]